MAHQYQITAMHGYQMYIFRFVSRIFYMYEKHYFLEKIHGLVAEISMEFNSAAFHYRSAGAYSEHSITYISTVPGHWKFEQMAIFLWPTCLSECGLFFSAGRRRRRVLICVLFVTMNFVLILFLWNEGAVGLYVPWCYQSEASIRVLFVTMHFVLILFLWNEAAVGLYVLDVINLKHP